MDTPAEEQRNATTLATSSRSTYRASVPMDCSLLTVRIEAGASALARTPTCRDSSATDRISATTPALLAAYAATPRVGVPSITISEAKYTIDPLARTTAGRNARVVRYAVLRLMRN